MGVSHDLAMFAVGLCSATFFWIAAVVQIEGDRRAPITSALTVTTAALGLLALGDLARTLFPQWAPLQNRIDGWLIATITSGWYATAIYQTRLLFSRQRWPLARRLLWLVAGSGVLLAIAGSIWPTQLHLTALAVAPTLGPLAWAGLAQLIGSLALAGGVYVRARYIARRSRQGHRPEGQQRYRVGPWGLPATILALIAVSTAIPITRWGSELGRAAWFFPLWSVALALGVAALLLSSLTTNRALLGRPMRARRLAVRWLLLGGFFVGLALIAWLDGTVLRIGLLLVTVGAPTILATLDLRLIRFYREHVERYRQFIGATIIDSSFAGAESYARQMEAIFDALIRTLQPDAVYLSFRAGLDEAPYERRYQWDQIPPRRPFSTRYDVCPIMANGQEIGLIALYGPGGVAYSRLELDLAEAHAAAIASLYRAHRHAHAFESLVVEHDRRSQETLQAVHSLLHDQLVGNLDVVEKGVQLIRPRLDLASLARVGDLLDEVQEGAREAMATVRQTLQQQQRELFPTTR